MSSVISLICRLWAWLVERFRTGQPPQPHPHPRFRSYLEIRPTERYNGYGVDGRGQTVSICTSQPLHLIEKKAQARGWAWLVIKDTDTGEILLRYSKSRERQI